MFGVLISITSLYGVFFAVMFTLMTLDVIRVRLAHRFDHPQSQADDFKSGLHLLGNFLEYVPIALILMAFLEINQAPNVSLHILGSLLIVARLLHWTTHHTKNERTQHLALKLTLIMLAGSALLLSLLLFSS